MISLLLFFMLDFNKTLLMICVVERLGVGMQDDTFVLIIYFLELKLLILL